MNTMLNMDCGASSEPFSTYAYDAALDRDSD